MLTIIWGRDNRRMRRTIDQALKLANAVSVKAIDDYFVATPWGYIPLSLIRT